MISRFKWSQKSLDNPNFAGIVNDKTRKLRYNRTKFKQLLFSPAIIFVSETYD